MKKIFKIAALFEKQLEQIEQRPYSEVTKMQSALYAVAQKLEPWHVAPKLLSGLTQKFVQNAHEIIQPDQSGIWGHKTDLALYFFNLLVNYVKSDKNFKQYFSQQQPVTRIKPTPPKTWPVIDPQTATANSEIIINFLDTLANIKQN
jgi:hypothetical protein